MPNDRGVEATRLRLLSRWMHDQVETGRLPGLAVQVMRQGACLFSEQVGWQDVETEVPVRPDALWRIYSMTKPITSVAALMLYEEGAFQLDQPVADFLPALGDLRVWQGPGTPLTATEALRRPITLHDLLTHQSGLVYGDPGGNDLERALSQAGLDFDRDLATMADAVARLAALPLAFRPGHRWAYGLSTDVLGRVIEVVTGQPLGEVFARRIFGPLGMVDTGFDVPPDAAHRLATLYEQSGDGFARAADQDRCICPKTLQSGGAGLVSTVADYQRFADMLRRRGAYADGHLLGRKTVDLMVCNHMGGDLASRGQAHFSETTFEGIGFGLGVSVMLDPARAKILGSPGEFSWGGWASTAFWVDPVEDMSVLLMTQLTPSSAYPLRRQLRVLTYGALVG